MKTINRIVCFAALLLVTAAALRAAEPEKSRPSTKDAALQFILEKAQKYSEVGENAVAKAVDVATREAPVLIQEYLTWKTWELGIYVGVSAALVALGAGLPIFSVWSFSRKHRWIHVHSRNGDLVGEYTIAAPLVFTVTILSLVTGGVVFLHYIGDFLQVTLAPRVFLIEQVVHLAR